MQKAAIVILNYNGEKVLRDFLPSVINFSLYPVFLADNASTDQSLTHVNENFPTVEVIRLDKNYGFAEGYTKAFDKLKGDFEYYILLNSDVRVTANWDKRLIGFLENEADYLAVQPKILSNRYPEKFDHAGAGGGFIDRLGYPFCRGRIFGTLEVDLGQYDNSIDVDWTSGACMAIRATAYHQFNGFDPNFFAHMEEVDLCWRWRNEGFKLRYIGEVTVFHQGGATLPSENPQKTYLNFRNNLLTLYKNLSQKAFAGVYRKRIILDILASLLFLGQGRVNAAQMVLFAHRDFQKLKKQYYPNEDYAINQRSKLNSIVWAYYIERKKRFSDL